METIVCPYCNGSGCPQCQNIGRLQVSQAELQQLQAMMSANPTTNPIAQPYQIPTYEAAPAQKTLPGTGITWFELKTSTAGFISFLLLAALVIAGYFSQKLFGNYRPYAAALGSLGILTATYLVAKGQFWQYKEPRDFISVSKELELQKPDNLQ